MALRTGRDARSCLIQRVLTSSAAPRNVLTWTRQYSELRFAYFEKRRRRCRASRHTCRRLRKAQRKQAARRRLTKRDATSACSSDIGAVENGADLGAKAGVGEGLRHQVDVGTKLALLEEGVSRISGGEVYPERGIPSARLVGKLTSVQPAWKTNVCEKQPHPGFRIQQPECARAHGLRDSPDSR